MADFTEKVTYVADVSGLVSQLRAAEQATASMSGATATHTTAMAGHWSGLSAGFSGLQGAIAATGVSLGPVGAALGTVGGAMENLHGSTAKLGPGLMVAGTALAGIGAIGLEAAHKQEQAHVTLEAAIKNTGGSYEEFGGAINKVIGHMENYGHKSSDTQEALAKLTAATNDPKKALADMAVVSEIASFKHISLADAAGLVAKAHAGSTKFLKEFGVNVKDLSDAGKEATAAEKEHAKALTDTAKMQDELAKAQQNLTDLQARDSAKKKLTIADEQALRDARAKVTDITQKLGVQQEYTNKTTEKAAQTAQAAAGSHSKFSDIMDIVHNKIQGVDEAQSETFGGKMKGFETHVADLAATLGEKFGKELIMIGPALTGVGAAMQVFQAISASSALAAMLPWLPLIAAIAAAAAIVYLVVDNWKEVSKFLKDIWHDVANFVSDVFNGIVDFFKRWGLTILEILTGTWMIVEIVKHWQGIVDGIVDVVKGLGKGIADAASDVWDFFTGLPGKIWDLVKDAGKWLYDTGKAILQGLHDGEWDAIHAVLDFFSKLPGQIWDILKDAGKWLWDTGKNIIHGLHDGIWDVIHEVTDFFGKLGGTIGDAIGDAGKWLWDTGKNLIHGLVQGIESMGEFLKKKLLDFLKSFVPGPVLDFFGISSPSKMFAEIGGHLVGGLIAGVEGRQSALEDTMRGVAEGAMGAFRGANSTLEISAPTFSRMVRPDAMPPLGALASMGQPNAGPIYMPGDDSQGPWGGTAGGSSGGVTNIYNYNTTNDNSMSASLAGSDQGDMLAHLRAEWFRAKATAA